jgi:hypothetical protein
MESYFRQLKIGPHPGSESARALVASGLWLRAGFVGASAFLGGLSLLFGDEMHPVLALALAIGGGILASYAWRRSKAILDRADASTASPSVAILRRESDPGFGPAPLR